MLKSTLLARVPLLSGLDEAERTSLASRLTERMVHAGAPVFAKGDPGTSMFLVLKGSLRIFLPGPPAIDLKQIGEGEYFGELALFDDQPRSASVSAVNDAWIAELTRDDLLQYLQRSPSAIVGLLREMSSRLRATTTQLGDHMAKDVTKEVDEARTWGQRLADKVATLNGSWSVILTLLFLSFAWAGVNQVLVHPFDAYPYQFFNLFLAVLVALQGPLIVMSQNRQADKDRARSETDFRVNLKNEVGIEQILRDLEVLRDELRHRNVGPSVESAAPERAAS